MKPTVLVLVLALMSAGAIIALRHGALAEATTERPPLVSHTERANLTPNQEQTAVRATAKGARPSVSAAQGDSKIEEQLPEAGSALPLLSVIGFGVLLGGLASAFKTR